jgi:hypothetical protein
MIDMGMSNLFVILNGVSERGYPKPKVSNAAKLK